jgi:hypothetical protein
VFVNVTLFLLLCERDVTLRHASYVMYTLGELYSLLSVKLFTSIYWCLRPILVLGRTRLEPLEKLKRAHSNAFVIQGELRIVYHRYQSRLVVLVVINKRFKTLVNILVYDFCLAVCLRVKHSRELYFDA